MRQSPGTPRKAEPPNSVRSDRGSSGSSTIPRAPRRDKAASSEEQGEDAYEPSYSVRLTRPFLRVLQNSERIPVADVHQSLDYIVELTGDHDIGLKAAYASTPGDGGALDYAISSAATA